MSLGTDVSGITDLPSSEEPDDLCDEGDHDLRRDQNGYWFCATCERSLQSLCDWWGHDTRRNR